jgi:hypothetical protein
VLALEVTAPTALPEVVWRSVLGVLVVVMDVDAVDRVVRATTHRAATAGTALVRPLSVSVAIVVAHS